MFGKLKSKIQEQKLKKEAKAATIREKKQNSKNEQDWKNVGSGVKKQKNKH